MPTIDGRGSAVRWALMGCVVAFAAVVSACTDDTDVFTGGNTTGGSSQGGDDRGGGGSGQAGDTQGGGGSAQGGGGGSASECTQSSDCDALFGTAPCGSWTCDNGQCAASAPSCVDADFDGYGSGAGCACAALDCDDNDDTVTDTVASAACYSGDPADIGVGTCVAGTQACVAGVWSPCSGEVTPSGEACNNQDDDCSGTPDDGLGTFTCGLGACMNSVAACTGGVVGICTPLLPAANETCGNLIDDNCNGVVDEGCSTNCIPVAPGGNDTTAGALTTPNLAIPFATIQAAITWSVAHPTFATVCVAGGALCSNASTFTGNVTMSNGVQVLGSYQSSNWTQCSAITTTIAPQTATGVTFPNTVQSATSLDHFQINRFSAGTTAAVTIDGATNANLSNLLITANAASLTIADTYGVNVINGGQARISGSHIEAGLGSTSAIGVRSIASTVNLIANCSQINAFGRCGQSSGGNTSPGIRHGNGGAGQTYGVLLQDSPASTIETTGIQMGNADQGAGIKITGASAGVLVRGNNIFVFDGVTDSHGLWMEDCAGDAPWVVNNEVISGNGSNDTSRADGVRSIGDCHPVIDSNVRIQGGGEGNAAFPNGVHCGANAQNVRSMCAVLNNQLITGAQFGFPPQVTGVRCDSGSCLRVAGNVITARGATTGYGVWLEDTGATIDANIIRGGCSTTAIGVHSRNSFARLTNNRIFGYWSSDCPVGGGVPSVDSTGLESEPFAGLNEVDVTNNDIDGGATQGGCNSRGILIVAGSTPPTGPTGIFRNNIVRAGRCTGTHYNVQEVAANADPRLFQNNDLDPFNAPTALYFDQGTTAITMIAGVDALMGASNNLSADALYVAYDTDFHLTSTSLCIGAGKPLGAPALDMDGQMRNAAAPDIGADQF